MINIEIPSKKILINLAFLFDTKYVSLDDLEVTKTFTKGDVEFICYSNVKKKSFDIIICVKDKSNCILYSRVYSNGFPTKNWQLDIIFEPENRSILKVLMKDTQSLLPEGHGYTEMRTVSLDGLKFYTSQLNFGYSVSLDKDGNKNYNTVYFSEASFEDEVGLGVYIRSSDRLRIRDKDAFNKLLNYIEPFLIKLGLDNSDVKMSRGSVKIDLPVLTKLIKE